MDQLNPKPGQIAWKIHGSGISCVLSRVAFLKKRKEPCVAFLYDVHTFSLS